jgi:RimJ/RimL family protein N-acetyltransferase
VTAGPELVAAFPPFALRVTTPRLELRYPTDDDVVAMFAAARRGIHAPEDMPFGVAWTDGLADPDAGVRFLQHAWAARASLGRDSWHLHLAVVEDGTVLGGQSLLADAFAVLRTVGTGSWLARPYQGRGLGTEMRSAVLHLAFVGLGARVATSSAFADNLASLRVSEKLGYEPNGEDEVAPRGVARRHLHRRLTRERWQVGRRDDIALHGLEPCLALLGADHAPAGRAGT